MNFNKHDILFISLIVLIIPIPSVGLINFSIQEKDIIGEWDNASILNEPSHVFSNSSHVIITDKLNARILIAENSNWSNFVVITPVFSNNSHPTKIYETVATSNNTYYSIIQDGNIIHYNNSGFIDKIISVDNMKLDYGDEYIHIALDSTGQSDKILIIYITNIDGVNMFVTQSINQIEAKSTKILFYSGNADANTFSYNNYQPIIIGSNDDTQEILIYKFGWYNSTSYGIITTEKIPNIEKTNPISLLIHNAVSYTFFDKGIIISSNDRILVYDRNLNYAGEITDLPGLGIVSKFSSIISQSNQLIIANENHHIVFKLTVTDINKITTSEQSINTPNSSNDYNNILLISIFILLIGVFLIILIIRRNKSKVTTDKK